jgi:hypothetical protein
MSVDHPPGMIKEELAVIGFFAAQTLDAEIYRSVDAEGRTHFSDRQPIDAAGQILKPDPGRTTPQDPHAPKTSDGESSLGHYDAFEILAPSDGAVLVKATETLAINLIAEPALVDGQHLELLLNGRPGLVEPGSTRFQLDGLGFGSHRLQTRFENHLGAVVAATPVHEIHLRQSIPLGVLH